MRIGHKKHLARLRAAQKYRSIIWPSAKASQRDLWQQSFPRTYDIKLMGVK